MRNLAIIPARGGSKRIPGKNIKDFLGKPIIAYPIGIAKESQLFDEIMVSTDDEEIAAVARKYGAKIPFQRSPKSSDDFATLSDVVEEVKSKYSEMGEEFDYICCILPTSPLISVSILNDTLKALVEKMADSIRPVVRFSYPIQRALRMDEKGWVEMIASEHVKTRSQDLEPTFHDSGQFYWMRFESCLKGTKKMGYEIPETHTQDIDTLTDWSLCELKYQMLNS